MTAEDASGIAKTEVKVDGGPWTAYSEPVSLTADGDHTVAYRVTDRAGNVAEDTVSVKKDATAPLTTAQFAAAATTAGTAPRCRSPWRPPTRPRERPGSSTPSTTAAGSRTPSR
ncbi:OmpL47-type beta-barrel domain-containing protein [Streptosporangium lutulentum]